MPHEAEAFDQAKKSSDRDTATADLISKLQDRIYPPEDIRCEIDRWESMRSYVHTDAMLMDEDDAVGTNYILRTQQAALANIAPVDLAPIFKPRRYMGVLDQNKRNGLVYPPDFTAYAKTHEILADFQATEGGLQAVLHGAAQDAMTLPVSWIKMYDQDDPARTPVGQVRNNDQLDMIARYTRLKNQFDDDLFTKQAAEYEEMRALRDDLKNFITDKIERIVEQEGEVQIDPATGEAVLDEQGEPKIIGAESFQEKLTAIQENPEMLIEVSDLPEIAIWHGFTFEAIDPEDVRWDWNVRRPEDLNGARWMAHRVWLTPDEIREKWPEFDEDELMTVMHTQTGDEKNLRGRFSGSNKDPEYGSKQDEERDRDVAASSDDHAGRGDTLAVWEYWDRVEGRVRQWVQGASTFLDEYTPDVLPSRFFPFYAVMLDRVTGKFLPPSDTELQESLQDEINRNRTWANEAKKGAHPRWLIARGLLRPGEKELVEQAFPWSMTEVEKAQDIASSVFQLTPSAYNPALYDHNSARLELQQMGGVPAAALGAGAGTGLATDSAIANEQTQNQQARRQAALLAVASAIYRSMAEINAQLLDEGEVQDIVGPGAVWFDDLDRQTILTRFNIEAGATFDDANTRLQELAVWEKIIAMQAQGGLPLDPIAIGTKILELAGVRENLATYLDLNALQQIVQQGGLPPEQAEALGAPAGGPQASTPAPAAAPAAQGGFGAEGGAPAGQGFEQTPTVESLPGPV